MNTGINKTTYLFYDIKMNGFLSRNQSSSLNYTMILKYSLIQTDSLANQKVYICFFYPAQNRHKLKSDYFKILYRIFVFAIHRQFSPPLFRQFYCV